MFRKDWPTDAGSLSLIGLARKPGILIASAVVALVALACSGSSGTTVNACVSSAFQLGGPGCASCANDNCGTQVGRYQGGCAAYLACVCPEGGAYDAGRVAGCHAKAGSSCRGASQALAMCLQDNCYTPCGPRSLDGG